MSNNTKVYGGDAGYTVELTTTINAGAVAGRFLKADGSDYASTSDDTAGVVIGARPGEVAADDNEEVTCQVSGVAIVEAGAAIATRFKQVETDSSGRVIGLNSGKLRGIALDTAAGAGDPIRVLITTLTGTVA